MAGLSNYMIETKKCDGEKTGVVKIGRSAEAIVRELHALTRGWPKRVGDRLFTVEDQDRLTWHDTCESLFAWIGRQYPGSQANAIRWAQGEDKISRAVFMAHVQQTAEYFDAVESMPHFPPQPRIYYCHPQLPDATGEALRAFLDRFCPATDADYSLLMAAALTTVWGGSPGQRPAFLVESDGDDNQGGRGVGKSKFAQAMSVLAGGHIDARPQEDIDKLMTRLLSPTAMDRRIALLDNVKTLRFSWSDLEALVTTDVISGRALYVGEGRRLNNLLWFMTLNGASLSRDMAQRCVPIRLKRPMHDPSWEAETFRLIAERRWEIIADCVAELKRDARPLDRYSRWSAWESAVLSRVPEPAEAQQVIAERQAAMDDDQAEAGLVRDGLVTLLRDRGHDPETEAVWIGAAQAAAVVNEALGEHYPTNKAGTYLRTLAIVELRRSDRGHGRGWVWRGARASAAAAAVSLGAASPFSVRCE
jgi:hypothetical protein